MTYDDFATLAREFHVSAVEVSGDFGVFRSAVDDVIVLGNYAVEGTWARNLNGLVQKYFLERGGGTYVDIGANIGLNLVPIAQAEAVRCIALEPEPQNYANLCRNLEVNCSHDNVVAYKMAAFFERTTLDFEVVSGNSGDYRIRIRNDDLGKGKQRKTIVVNAAPLDDIVGSVEGALAVKIDVQGAEPFVIEGGRRTLENCGLLIVEFSPYAMHRMGSDPERVIAFLEQHFEKVSFWRFDVLANADMPIRDAVKRLRRLASHDPDDIRVEYDLVAVR